MYTTVFKRVVLTLSGTLLSSLVAIASADEASQFQWLQDQLSRTDGSTVPVHVKSDQNAAGAAGARGDRLDRADPRADEQFKLVQRQLRKTDGNDE